MWVFVPFGHSFGHWCANTTHLRQVNFAQHADEDGAFGFGEPVGCIGFHLFGGAFGGSVQGTYRELEQDARLVLDWRFRCARPPLLAA